MTIPTSNSANFMLLYNEKSPHAAPSACCPPRGRFCLGAARRQKKPPRCTFGLLPPEGEVLPWGGPATKKAPTLHLRLAAPRGSFHLGTARRQKRSRSPLYHLCQNLQPLPLLRHKPQQTVHIRYQEKPACASYTNLWHKESFLITNYLSARFVRGYAQPRL
jgi:hypothetical protein